MEQGEEIKYNESLFKSGELYQILFDNTSDAIVVTEGSILIECNKAALLMFGFTSKKEFTGLFPADFSSELQHDEIRWGKASEFISPANSETTQKFNCEYLKSDGTPFDAEVVVNSFRYENHSLQQYTIRNVDLLKKLEEELIRAKKKYEKLFENVQDVLYRIDLDGKIVEISPSVVKYSKYALNEIIGQPIEKFYLNPGDREALLMQIKEKGEVLDFEVLLKTKDNEPSWASVNAHYIFDDNGQVAGIEGAIRDLSGRKMAEEKLKLSLSLLQATLDSSTDAILVISQSGKITSYNKQFREMFGIPEELLQAGDDASILQFILNQIKNPEQFTDKIKSIYQNIESESIDTISFVDGRTIKRFSCPQKLDGKPIGRVWSFNDITLRNKSEKQLQLMAHTLKSINECISITDTDDRILFVNEAFLKTYGFTEDEIIGEYIFIVRCPESDPKVVNEICNITADSGWQGELLNKRKDGSVFPISLSTSVVQNEKGEILGMVGVAVDISERKLVENELKESEERYRMFFEGSPDAIFLADIENGIIIDANPASATLLKKPLGEIVGMHQSMLHPKRDESFYRKAFKSRILNSNQKTDVIFNNILVVCSDGSEIPVEILSNIIHIKGKPVIQGVFRNITDRRQAEKAIQESEKRFRLLIENQGEGVGIVDQDENFVFANPAAELIFGVTQGGLVNHNLREFIAAENFEQILQESEKRKKNEKSTYEFNIKTSEGITRNLLITSTPQTDDEGNFIGTFGVFRDITDRKQAEEMRRQSEMKYRNLIETMPDGFYRSTPEGKFVEVNQAMVNILGYESKEELMAIDIKTQLYFDLSDRESHALHMNQEELDIFPLKKKDGTAVYVEDHGWYVTDQNGQIIFHEGISRDVTERKMVEIQLQKYSQELQELNVTKDKFFSIIAHDLKSPFNSITGLSELLKDEAKNLDAKTIEQYAGIIHSTSQNTYQLLENLLEWALIQQSGLSFRPDSVNLKKITGEVAQLLAEMANRKSITIQSSISERLIVMADENMLKTILRNLISNALKFTPAGGKVEVNAILQPGLIEITVKDNGIGINKEDILKIFKIDSNYSKLGTENEKGTGLGLALCVEFVEKHGGKIWVESEEGEGSEFKFTIPGY